MPDDPQNELMPPQSELRDRLYDLGKEAAGIVPGGGSLYQLVLLPPYKRREQKWMEDVANAIYELQEAGRCVVDKLHEDDRFVDALLHASLCALRTANHEKREALKNAVLNSALPDPPDESKQQMFLNLVDQFTAWHILILKLFRNPDEWFESHNTARPFGASVLAGVLTTAYPELDQQREFYDAIAADLKQRSLLTVEGFHKATISGQGLIEKRTTSLGDEFIAFISSPVEE